MRNFNTYISVVLFLTIVGCGNERLDVAPRHLLVRLSPRSRASRHRHERHAHIAKPPVVEALAMSPLEVRTVCLVEDHPHADHAGAEGVG